MMQTEAPAVSGQALPELRIDVPLVVDMDRLLVRADLGAETMLASASVRIGEAFGSRFPKVAGAHGAGVEALSRQGVDVATLPLAEDLVDYLRSCFAEGRDIHLISAAPQKVVEGVAARVGVFTTATGSRRFDRLTDARKREYIRRKFPGGFSYAGLDPVLLRDAKSAILPEALSRLSQQVDASRLEVEYLLTSDASGFVTWAKALRVHQWAKNLLLFVPMLLGHAYGDGGIIAQTIAGFFILSLLASGTYLLNDILDLSSDRRHQSKRNRPLASGALGVGSAARVAGVMIGSSLVMGLMLNAAFFAALSAYFVMTMAYSLVLKRQMLVDVFVLASLFTTRLAMGVALAGVAASNWLLTFAMFFFLSLSLAKRHVDVIAAGQMGLPAVPGRDYRASDYPLTISLGMACNAVATLVLCLYLTNDPVALKLYSNPIWLWAAVFVIFFWSTRIWGLSHRGVLDSDPVAFAIRDPLSIGLGFLVLGAFGLAL